MTKERLEKFKKLSKKVKANENKIASFHDTTMDSVTGSSPEFPYTKHTIRIEGVDEAVRKELGMKHQKERIAWEREKEILLEYIKTIEDPIDQSIVEKYVLQDKTWKQIGQELNYSESGAFIRYKKILKKE